MVYMRVLVCSVVLIFVASIFMNSPLDKLAQPSPVLAQGDDVTDCLMNIEIFEVIPRKDRGDSLFGLRGGDMELELHLAVTNGRRTWETVWPGNGDWEYARRNRKVETDDLRLLIDMTEFTDDELYIYIVAIDLDPIAILGYNLEPAIFRASDGLLELAIDVFVPRDLQELANRLADYGIEEALNAITEEDIIGQGGLFLNEENGWGTREILRYTTPDDGLEIEYQIRLIGEECATDKVSV
jgi:hypothetical protein